MLRKIKDLRGIELYATDGELGKVTEFYFDDLDWTVLYMAIDTGSWLPGRRVLVPPAAFGHADWVEGKINVLVTREEIETSPEIDLHQPVTREQEVAYFGHFGWACLWNGELRASREIVGLSIVTTDEQLIGSVEDLIIDDLWIIRYLTVRVPSEAHEYLIPPRLMSRGDWAGSRLLTSLSADIVRSAPEFDSGQMIKRGYEELLYKHFAAQPYWK